MTGRDETPEQPLTLEQAAEQYLQNTKVGRSLLDWRMNPLPEEDFFVPELTLREFIEERLSSIERVLSDLTQAVEELKKEKKPEPQKTPKAQEPVAFSACGDDCGCKRMQRLPDGRVPYA